MSTDTINALRSIARRRRRAEAKLVELDREVDEVITAAIENGERLNVRAIADELGVARTTIYRKLTGLGMVNAHDHRTTPPPAPADTDRACGSCGEEFGPGMSVPAGVTGDWCSSCEEALADEYEGTTDADLRALAEELNAELDRGPSCETARHRDEAERELARRAAA